MRYSVRCSLGSVCLFAACVLNLGGCGGGSGSGSGGGFTTPITTTPQTTEILYAKNDMAVTAFTINASTGGLTVLQTVNRSSSGYVAGWKGGMIVAPSNANYLYAIDNEDSGVDAYSVASDGALSLVSGSPFAMPASISPLPDISGLAVNPAGTAVYAIDGGASSIAEFQVNTTTGVMTPVSNGFAPVPGLAASSPEQAVVDPSGQFLYVTDSYLPGSSMPAGISAMTIDPASGNLGQAVSSPFSLPSNSQPIDIVTDPSGNFVYAALSNAPAAGGAIAGFTRNSTTGNLTQISGSPFASTSSAYTQTYSMVVHPSGKFLYAMNLNGGTVSAFTIDAGTGALTPITGSPFPPQKDQYGGIVTQGPIAVEPAGAYLYVGCNFPGMAIYQINQSTGALTIASGSPETVPQSIQAFTVIKKP